MKHVSIVSAFLLGISFLNPSVDAAEVSFTDYGKDNFGYESVSYLVSGGIITGYENGSFQPNKVVNRLETAIMFQRALGLTATTSGSGFSDVPSSSKFASTTAAVKEARIFNGSSNGTFGPNDQLTREQMASVLVRALDLKPVSDVTVNLNDLHTVSASHVDDVKVLYQNGITTGKKDGSYDPKGAVTRAEFSVFLSRGLDARMSPLPGEGAPGQGAPIGGVPGAGAPGQQVPSKPAQVTHTALSTTNGTVTGQITSDGEAISIVYDLSSLPKEASITEGTLSISENRTLSITNIPSPLDLFITSKTQGLQQGSNKLNIVNEIGTYDLELIRFYGNFQVGGTLHDASGYSQNVQIQFIVE